MTIPHSPLVATAAGPVLGVAGARVAAFLGIPYAAPPVAERRFALPEPPEHWDTARHCVAPGDAAPQSVSTATDFDAAVSCPEQSEDCLWLNVWTPAPEHGADLPVLVWFHGGAFVHGTVADPVYDGSRLAASGLVVVTVNTRLGALGMLDLRELMPDGQCNLSLHDQAAALTWVRENIGAFGGSPGSITVAGESVGGTSALVLLGSSLEGRPRRAIAQSGSVEQFMSAEASEATARAVLSAAGIAPGRVGELAAVGVDRLLAAQGEVLARVWTGAPGSDEIFGAHAVSQLTPFLPTQDDLFVSGTPVDGLRSHAVGADLLVGTTRSEASLYRLTSGGLAADWVLANAARAGVAGLTAADDAELMAAYTHGGSIDLEALETDRYFRSPALRAADVLGDVAGASVTTYRIDLAQMEAAHMVDVPLTFGTLDSPLGSWFSTQAADAREMQETSAVVRRAWAAFCADGTLPGGASHVAGSTWSNTISADGVRAEQCDRRVRAMWRTFS